MSKREKPKKCTSIGGQAVIEGVMMRSQTAKAMAVRDEDGIIRVESKRLKKSGKGGKILKFPIIRGVVAFINSFVDGMRTLTRSAEVFGEGEPSKAEKWLSDKLKIDVMSVVIALALILGVGLAIALFVLLPQGVRIGLEMLVGGGFKFDVWAKNFIEGGLKLLIFISYIVFCTLIKDVKRTFMYHGAEHKTISCYESGKELTVENARSCTRVHDRCGTTFMVFVILISILVFALFECLVGQSIDGILRAVLKIALLPVVAGLSYELLKGLSKTQSPIVYPFKLPGLLLQRITTKEPTDDMLEVAIKAFTEVQKLDENPDYPEKEFVVPEKMNVLTERVYNELRSAGVDERAEAEWIVSLVVGVKRDELNSDKLVKAMHVEKINQIVAERKTGRPLWYCIGDTEFYGYTIKVDERVLIPRPETEILVENALKCIDENSKVLDLCTGSGAIAIAIKKESRATVVASDISADAINLAKENALANGVEIEFVLSDAFNGLAERKFDVIVSNPP